MSDRSPMVSPNSALLLFVILFCFSAQVLLPLQAKLLLEEGYSVSTLLDANKLTHPIFPSSILPRGRGGTHDFVILDSPNSAFYTISSPISQDSDIKRYSGNETSGFADGDLGSAMFDRPRSFTVDFKGNIYVADRSNHAIRKITKSGVTTIAGGRSGKPGKVDGPAQYASFSDDFELSFVPETCALLIADRGNRLIRHMNLNPNDCESGSQWQLGVSGSVLLGVLSLILGSLITVAVGLIAYPSIYREVNDKRRFRETWKRFQINLERRAVTVYCDTKNVVANSTVYLLISRIVRMSLSQLFLMFKILSVDKQVLCREQVSLLDSDVGCNHETPKLDRYSDQLKMLLSSEESQDASDEVIKTITQQDKEDHLKTTDVSRGSDGSIDAMIHANIMGFVGHPTQRHPSQGPLVGSSSGLVKRKQM